MLANSVSLEVNPLAIVIHAGLFFIVLAAMTRLVLRPLGRVREARQAATKQRVAEAAQLSAQALALEQAYQQCIEAALLAARAVKDRLRQDGFAQAAGIMAQARADAERAFEAAKAQFAQEADAARATLSTSAKEFSRLIAERILERAIRANTSSEGSNPGERNVIGVEK